MTTNILSLLCFERGEFKILKPFSDIVQDRFLAWICRYEQMGCFFTPEQRAYLELLKDHIATHASVVIEDLDFPPFIERGGSMRMYQLFGADLEDILVDLNEQLSA